ncbi:TetR/AcrR family transcriptional regulator [Solidesulfovibrio sp.]|uniref:TetR/AcrR family transcriptional regulator n=1 Tax=Solidesulfovibrio sp. TaxID=2910990 RepID=UPI00262C0AFF|nr:TetR/AcrR family transcriptional regulator [Solidesulfovibrio sp.]
MFDACRRKKQPQLVRAQLLEATAHIVAECGPAGLTLDGVARRAGVSKGGLIHHFPSKQALIEGLFAAIVQAFEDALAALIARDDDPRGRFTRAYVAAVLAPCDGVFSCKLMDACALALTGDVALHEAWHAWMRDQLVRHGEDAENVLGRIIRYAADGLWLEARTHPAGFPLKDRQAVIERLTAMTYDL